MTLRSKVTGLSLLTVAAMLFAGCASTTPAARTGGACALPQRTASNTFHAGSSGETFAARGASSERMSGSAVDLNDHAGVPTPEPARPTREMQFAGPTPQVPIPVSGGVAVMPATF